MSNVVTNIEADIDQFPELDKNYPAGEGTQLTIGDLHGNAVKLLYFLKRHGFINLSKADYENFVAIYRKGALLAANTLDVNDLKQFKEILSRISVIKHKNSIVRLIGDELSDRGSNDYLTLKLLEKIVNGGVEVETLLSNHSAEFIEAYETGSDFMSINIDCRQAISMINLAVAIDNQLIPREEVETIINTIYKPTLKAVSYTLDKVNNGITIYSHAPIGINDIEFIANKLNVPYKDATIEELAQTIEQINANFSGNYVNNNKVHTLLDPNVMKQVSRARIDQQKDPFIHLIWNRSYDNIKRPEKHNGFNITFVHGHDSKGKTERNIFNLDNLLGKTSFEHKGNYNILYSHESKLPRSAIIPFKASVVASRSVATDPVVKKAPAHPDNTIGEVKKVTYNKTGAPILNLHNARDRKKPIVKRILNRCKLNF